MKYQPFLVLSILFFGLPAFGQNAATYITRITELKNLKIDTVLFYEPCAISGLPPLTDTCRLTHSKYLIWKEQGNTFIQKFADCFDKNAEGFVELISKPLIVKDSRLLKFVENNFELFANQAIEPAIIKENTGNMKVYKVLKAYDDCFTAIDLYLATQIIKRGFTNTDVSDGNIRDLDSGHVRLERPNLNYKYNISTIVCTLKSFLENEIERLETKNEFKY
jgi:hypothetical protein